MRAPFADQTHVKAPEGLTDETFRDNVDGGIEVVLKH